MAIGKDTALRLVLIDDQANEAEAIVSSLRNAGIAVRPLRAESLDELASQLAQQPVDMVLAEHASTLMPFNEVAAVVMGCGRDVPLLAVLDGVTDEILDSVQSQGAQAVARSQQARLAQSRPITGTPGADGYQALVQGADEDTVWLMRLTQPLARWLDFLL